MEKEKVRRFHVWHGPVISLDIGESPWLPGEAYRWAGDRWHEVDAIALTVTAREIAEADFAWMYPTAAKAARWLPRFPALIDPEEVRLDNILKTLEELQAERLARDGPPDRPPEAAA